MSNGEVVYYLDKFQEYITCNRDDLGTERTGIFFGTQKNTKVGSIQIKNIKTGDNVIVKFISKFEGKLMPPGTISGEVVNAKGVKQYELKGNVFEQI